MSPSVRLARANGHQCCVVFAHLPYQATELVTVKARHTPGCRRLLGSVFRQFISKLWLIAGILNLDHVLLRVSLRKSGLSCKEICDGSIVFYLSLSVTVTTGSSLAQQPWSQLSTTGYIRI